LNAGCAFVNERCQNKCQSDEFAPSYSLEFSELMYQTVAESCDLRDCNKEDWNICGRLQGGEKCISKVRSDGVTPCEWYFDPLYPYLAYRGGGGCTAHSCGDSSCAAYHKQLNLTGLDRCPAFEQREREPTCEACLEAYCGWTGKACTLSCDNALIDFNCFDMKTFPKKNTQEICQVATSNETVCSFRSNATFDFDPANGSHSTTGHNVDNAKDEAPGPTPAPFPSNATASDISGSNQRHCLVPCAVALLALLYLS